MENIENIKNIKAKAGKSFGRITKFGWIAVLALFAMSDIGRGILSGIGQRMAGIQHHDFGRRAEEEVVPAMNYDLDTEILASLDTAHEAAQAYADEQLDLWVEELMGRVDEHLLDDYFSFVNTKARELSALGHSLGHIFSSSSMTAEEALAEDLEDKISKKVIRPEVSQARIKNITDEAVNRYLVCLDKELQKIQAKHRIPTPAWNEYIADICGMTVAVETKNTPISFKALYVTGGVAALAVAVPVLKKVGAMIAERIARKAGASIAVRGGTKIASKAAAKAGGKTVAKAIPIVGWGIVAATFAWDLVDYKMSAARGKAELRENIRDYLGEIKRELMGSTENSIMGAVTDWENITVNAGINI